jgi:hypothetical protein
MNESKQPIKRNREGQPLEKLNGKRDEGGKKRWDRPQDSENDPEGSSQRIQKRIKKGDRDEREKKTRWDRSQDSEKDREGRDRRRIQTTRKINTGHANHWNVCGV